MRCLPCWPPTLPVISPLVTGETLDARPARAAGPPVRRRQLAGPLDPLSARSPALSQGVDADAVRARGDDAHLPDDLPPGDEWPEPGRRQRAVPTVPRA